mmetsp:Transcript_50656/g.82903  ORF Transcript_50656/g.82903 Transcript_50656/m.82903 type:complete len:86 (-) Transcript_50656:738-995(-)
MPSFSPAYKTVQKPQAFAEPPPPFFASTYVCLRSARSDGPLLHGRQSTTYIVPCGDSTNRQQRWDVHLNLGGCNQQMQWDATATP